jgi:hypothetical protein
VIEFRAAAGRTYSLLYTDSLSVPDWKKLTDVAAQPAVSLLDVKDSDFGKVPVRFYKLMTPASP